MQNNEISHVQTTKHVVIAGILSAILLVGQVGMSFLPNIEPVSTLIILYTLTYKKHVFPIIYRQGHDCGYYGYE